MRLPLRLRQALRIFRVGGLSLALLLASGLTEGVVTAASAVTKQTSPVKSLQDGHIISGSKAKLQRRADSLKIQVVTRELLPAQTVDVLWAVFNDPSACTNGNKVTSSLCGPGDLFSETTGATLQFARHVTANANGRIAYEVSIAVSDTSGCIPGFPCRDGVTNPLGAEVHSVLFSDGNGLQAAQFGPP